MRFGFRLFLGKNKVLQFALGTSPSTECLPNIYKISKLIKGGRGILITPKNKQEVLYTLSGVSASACAKAGCIAPKTIELEVRRRFKLLLMFTACVHHLFLFASIWYYVLHI